MKRKLLIKNPEYRIDHNYIKNSKWFKYFYESDATDEYCDLDLNNYNFSKTKIFQLFHILKENCFEVDFFLKIYNQQIKKYSTGKTKSMSKNVTPNNEYEYFEKNAVQKISETTSKNKIKHNIVESEIYSLENSTQSFFEKIGRNKLPLNSEQKHCLRREISNEFLLSDIENPDAYTILNQMITFTRLKFDEFRSGEAISDSTVSKFCKEPLEGLKEKFVLTKSDQLILRVLEKMIEAGFPLKQIQESIKKKKLDAACATFRLLAQSLSTG
jgi:hypothetical protein